MKIYINIFIKYFIICFSIGIILILPPVKNLVSEKTQGIQEEYIEYQIIRCFNNDKTYEYSSAINSEYNTKQSLTIMYLIADHSGEAENILENYSVGVNCMLKYTPNSSTISIVDHYFFPFLNVETQIAGYELRVFSVLRFDSNTTAEYFVRAKIKNNILRDEPDALFFYFFGMESSFGVELADLNNLNHSLVMDGLNKIIEQDNSGR